MFDIVRISMPKKICDLIEKYFARDYELNDYIVCTNEFVKIINIYLLCKLID